RFSLGYPPGAIPYGTTEVMPFHEPSTAAISSLGDLDGAEHVSDDEIGSEPFEIGFRLEDNAMSEHWRSSGFDVVWDDVVASIERGDCARDDHHADRRARACAK